ncbi:hypothetical protein CCE01nite_34840 [Cellulomonas cellasea]|uniref:DUF418 domain-containing protein n=1 Tax=Cellulomonas cellasea TaxID=43670 RepID=A0A4Y3L1V9_9CELL|nr:hypothetical protein CCE01nite_34840 [Cellulomonas cellasea]
MTPGTAPSDTVPSVTTRAPAPGRPRIAALDVLRGLGLCGILVPNFLTVARFGYESGDRPPATLADASGWIELLAHQRFFPIFSLLFGIGFTLFLESATRRGAPHPRVLLLRRLLLLLPLGIGHAFVHPGEALSQYAVFGLLVLLPSSWLPRWLVAAGGAVGVVLALWLFEGGLPLIPGLFLVGSALVRYGVVDRMGRPTLRGTGPVFLVFAVLAGVAVPWHVGEITETWSSHSSGVTGVLLAGAYVTGTLVLLSTPARSVLTAALAPLGRMALTNYVTATFLMIGAGHLLDLPHADTYTGLLLAALGILVAQWAFSTLWLRHHRQGPLEWLWRRGTWWGSERG